MRDRFLVWVPSTGEESILNLVALALVVLLVALGFDVLKLPATIAPDRPPIPQVAGLGALLMLNLVLVWTLARDDYVRFGYGFPRAAATLALLSLLASGAILVRGLWDGTYQVDPAQPFLWSSVIGIAIAGQFVSMAFCATYFLKKTDNAKVREFKRLAKPVCRFVEAVGSGRLQGKEFEDCYAAILPDMVALPETARAARLALDRSEAEYAYNFGLASNRLTELLRDVLTADIPRKILELRRDEKALLVAIVGRKAFDRWGDTKS